MPGEQSSKPPPPEPSEARSEPALPGVNPAVEPFDPPDETWCAPGRTAIRSPGGCEAIQARKTPLVVALTGFGSDDDIARSRAAGFDEHLTKPVEPQQLLQVIARRAHPG